MWKCSQPGEGPSRGILREPWLWKNCRLIVFISSGDRSEDMTDIIGRHYLPVTGVTRRNGTRPSPLNLIGSWKLTWWGFLNLPRLCSFWNQVERILDSEILGRVKHKRCKKYRTFLPLSDWLRAARPAATEQKERQRIIRSEARWVDTFYSTSEADPSM